MEDDESQDSDIDNESILKLDFDDIPQQEVVNSENNALTDYFQTTGPEQDPLSSGLEQHKHTFGLEQDPHTSVLKQDPYTSGLEQGQHTSGLGQDPHTSVLKQDPYTSVLKQDPYTSGLEQGQHTSGLEQYPHTSELKQDSHTSLREDPYTSGLEQGQHTSGLEQDLHTSGLEQYPHTSELKQDSHTSLREEDPHNDKSVVESTTRLQMSTSNSGNFGDSWNKMENDTNILADSSQVNFEQERNPNLPEQSKEDVILENSTIGSTMLAEDKNSSCETIKLSAMIDSAFENRQNIVNNDKTATNRKILIDQKLEMVQSTVSDLKTQDEKLFENQPIHSEEADTPLTEKAECSGSDVCTTDGDGKQDKMMEYSFDGEPSGFKDGINSIDCKEEAALIKGIPESDSTISKTEIETFSQTSPEVIPPKEGYQFPSTESESDCYKLFLDYETHDSSDSGSGSDSDTEVNYAENVDEKDNSAENVGKDNSAENVGKDNSAENVGKDNSAENVGKDNSAENVGKDNSAENVGKDNSAENVGKDNSAENVGKDNSAENVGKDNSAENVEKDNSAENVGKDNFVDNVGKDNSAENVEKDNSAENVGKDNSAENVGKDNSAENVGKDNSAENVGKDNFAENVGKDNFAENVGKDNSAENVGKDNSAENVEKDHATENVGKDNLAENVEKEHEKIDENIESNIAKINTEENVSEQNSEKTVEQKTSVSDISRANEILTNYVKDYSNSFQSNVAQDSNSTSQRITNDPNDPEFAFDDGEGEKSDDTEMELEKATETDVDFGPILSLSGVHQITAEEFEQMGSETDVGFTSRHEREVIDPKEILSAPLCNRSKSKTVKKESLKNGLDKNLEIWDSEKSGLKIKSEPEDDGYETPVSGISARRYSNDAPMSSRQSPPEQNPTSMINSDRAVRCDSYGLQQLSTMPSSLSSRTSSSTTQNMVYTIALKKTNKPTTVPPKIMINPVRRSHPQKTVKTMATILPKVTEEHPGTPTRKVNGKPPIRMKIHMPSAPVPKVNTNSFSVVSITQMMQRKHKIGSYKAPPIPPEYKKYLTSYCPGACLECGDSFTTKDTLEMHRTRVSIEIKYQCPLCKTLCVFYNKCAFLGHIRLHNKEQTLAKNPAIQVKADILTINLAPKAQVLKRLNMELQPIETLPVPDKPFICSECDKVFAHEFQLSNHFGIREMVCSFNFVCNTCNMVLPTVCAFDAHKRYHTMKPPYTCPECGYVDGDFLKFREHMTNECLHFSRTCVIRCEGVDSKCNIPCKHTEIRLSPFSKHLQMQHIIEKSSFKQFSDENTIITMKETLAKVQVHSMTKFNKQYLCDFCEEKTFENLEKAKDHMLNHVKEAKRNATYSYICTICPERAHSIFVKKDLLKNHMLKSHGANTNSKSKILNCCACNLLLDSYSKLLVHQLRVHEHINSEFYFCNTCKVMFENPELMKKHTCNTKTSVPLNLKEYNKPIVGKISPRVPVHIKPKVIARYPMVTLAKHSTSAAPPPIPRSQSSEKSQCLVCRIEFTSSVELLNHNQSEHSSFPCHLCGLTYTNRIGLDQHIQSTHEGEKPGFFCFLCKKKGIARLFSKQSLIEKHLLIKHRMSKAKINRFVANGKESWKSPDKMKRKVISESESESESSPVKRLRTECSGVYACVKCNFTTEDSTDFNGHIESHKTVDAIQCPECGLCFSVLPSLKKHLFMVHKIRNSAEYIQSKGIIEPEEMDSDSEDEFEVSTSPLKKSFTDIAPVQTVRKKKGPVGDLECRVCYREFENVNLLKNHMRVHGMAFIKSHRVSPKR